jgi:hypothetical protein
VATVLTAFGLYSAWVVLFQNTGYAYPYLSAFYSPTISIGNIPPAVWVFWAPLAFRFSCYYYRKAYFRSFFSDPRWCNFNERKRGPYKGETAFPWVLNNLHRYAFYITAAQVIILWWDAVQAFAFRGHIGIGLGSVIMLVNVVLLSGYTFGCHSFRHLIGGSLDCYTCSLSARVRFRLWKGSTVLNIRHAQWAWASLVSVWLLDVYIRLLHYGVLPDLRWIS